MNNQQISDIGIQEYRSLSDKPRLYIACLASYNAGWLHGKWIDATQGYDAVYEEIEEMLKDSPVTKKWGDIAEEWAIHDSENFGSYKVAEWGNLEELCEVASLLQEEQGELVLEIMNYLGSGTSLEDAKEFLENNYHGHYKDLGDYAVEMFDCGCYEIPKHIYNYIDFDAMGRDYELGGDIFTIDDGFGVHIFSNH